MKLDTDLHYSINLLRHGVECVVPNNNNNDEDNNNNNIDNNNNNNYNDNNYDNNYNNYNNNNDDIKIIKCGLFFSLNQFTCLEIS